MNRQQPMDLAELRLMVAQHLLNRDRKACSLVCKTWYTSFSPTLWSTFKANFDFSNPLHSPVVGECRVPKPCTICVWRKIIINHGHCIRHLEFVAVRMNGRPRELFQLLVEKCTSLTVLTYPRAYGDNAHDTTNRDLIKELVLRNSLIQGISTGSIPCLEQAMIDLPKLTRLEVEFHFLSDQAIHTLLTAFTCLEELELLSSSDNPSYASGSVVNICSQLGPLSSRPSSLRKITWPPQFTYTYGRPSPILRRCPVLEYLDFGGMPFIDNLSLQLLRSSDSFPRLSTLSIGGLEATQRLVLVAMSRSPWIRDLRLTRPHPKSLFVVAERYAQHLQHLVLTSVDCDILSPMVLLAQCSALKTLHIRALGGTAFDLLWLIDQPWACTQLEQLEMPIALEEFSLRLQLGRTEAEPISNLAASSMGEGQSEENMTEPRATKKVPLGLEQIETAFMERLGCLTQLRRLTLRPRAKIGRTRADKMVWRLRAGFCHLRGLSRLELLDLGNRKCILGIHEFEWMKRYWTSLSKVVIKEFDQARKRGWFRNEWPEVTVVELATRSI